jgi:hypothetical protein
MHRLEIAARSLFGFLEDALEAVIHRSKAADSFGRVTPLITRWIERLLATHDPSLTVGQYLALQAVSEAEVAGVELARRAGRLTSRRHAPRAVDTNWPLGVLDQPMVMLASSIVPL